jgi:hypothetical protein
VRLVSLKRRAGHDEPNYEVGYDNDRYIAHGNKADCGMLCLPPRKAYSLARMDVSLKDKPQMGPALVWF